MDAASPASLLTLPPELRNQIYDELFTVPVLTVSDAPPRKYRLPTLEHFGKDQTYIDIPRTPSNNKALLLTNRQLHAETQLLYLATTPFHVPGTATDPYAFAAISSTLPRHNFCQLRHIVLTAKIAHLRALNEVWCGLPFGHSSLELDTLAIVPKRADTAGSAYAEVADLSQSHTLAYILAETLKTLRNVRRVVVRNQGCFTDLVWRLVYRSLVYRLWRWGGSLCGLGFREWEDGEGQSGFEVLCRFTRGKEVEKEGWRDVLQEVNRLIGGEGSRDGMIEEA